MGSSFLIAVFADEVETKVPVGPEGLASRIALPKGLGPFSTRFGHNQPIADINSDVQNLPQSLGAWRPAKRSAIQASVSGELSLALVA